MENLHILLLHSAGHEWVAQWTRSTLRVKLLRTGFHSRKGLETNNTFKSMAKASPSSYVTRRPQELSLEEQHRVTGLCKGGCGLRCAAQPPLGLSQENRSLALTAPSDKAPAPLGAGASGETPRSAQTSGRVTQSGQNALTSPLAPAAAIVRVADARPAGPKIFHPRQPLESPIPKGDKGGKEELSGAGSPRWPELRTWG